MSLIAFEGRVLKRARITGVERYAHELYRHLSEVAELKLLSPLSTGKYYSHLWMHTVLPLRVLASGAKVLFCPVTDAPALLPRSIRLVVTIHDLAFLRYPEMYSKSFRAYYRAILPKVIERADAIICISQTEREFVEKEYSAAIGKIKVIHSGISTAFHDPGAPREKVILAVAAYNKHKNLARMLRAYESLVDEVPHNLVLVGGRRAVVSHDDEIEPVLQRLEKMGRVRRTGYIEDAELIRLYQTAEIFVFPSLFEGFGFPPLEAMASGCAVCASGVSSIPEVCGDAADFFDPLSEESIASSIKLLATDDAYRAELVRRGKLRAAQFSWTRTASETLRLLMEGRS